MKIKCPSCGSTNEDSMNFCIICGFQLNQKAVRGVAKQHEIKNTLSNKEFKELVNYSIREFSKEINYGYEIPFILDLGFIEKNVTKEHIEKEIIPVTRNKYGPAFRGFSAAMFGLNGYASTNGIITELKEVDKIVHETVPEKFPKYRPVTLQFDNGAIRITFTDINYSTVILKSEMYSCNLDLNNRFVLTLQNGEKLNLIHDYDYAELFETLLKEKNEELYNLEYLKRNYLMRFMKEVKSEIALKINRMYNSQRAIP